MAVVIAKDNNNREARYFIDGRLVHSYSLPLDRKVVPGRCRLGNWQPQGDQFVANRALRARIDEMAIWNRAISGTEILELAERGKPTKLWSPSRWHVII
jgi:hypothetical protein